MSGQGPSQVVKIKLPTHTFPVRFASPKSLAFESMSEKGGICPNFGRGSLWVQPKTTTPQNIRIKIFFRTIGIKRDFSQGFFSRPLLEMTILKGFSLIKVALFAATGPEPAKMKRGSRRRQKQPFVVYRLIVRKEKGAAFLQGRKQLRLPFLRRRINSLIEE